MTSIASVSSVLVAGAVLGTALRVRQRAAKAAKAHPPEGQLIAVDGLQVHAVIRGTGPDLVLIHGASGSTRDFSFGLIGRLVDRYRVIALDRPGLGHSASLRKDKTSLAAQAAVLARAGATLGVTRPLLVGHSFGGAVALAWALNHPAAALVTIGGAALPWPGKLALWYRANDTALGRAFLPPLVAAWLPESVVKSQIESIFTPASAPDGYARHLGTDLLLRHSQLANNLMQVNGLRAELVAQEPRYASLSLPFEMVHGTADTIVPLNVHSGPLAKRLPDAGLTVVEGGGHMLHHSHPDIVVAAIDRAARRAGLR